MSALVLEFAECLLSALLLSKKYAETVIIIYNNYFLLDKVMVSWQENAPGKFLFVIVPGEKIRIISRRDTMEFSFPARKKILSGLEFIGLLGENTIT